MTALNERAQAARRRLLRPWNFRLYLWARLPLAAGAGLRLERLDETGCAVSLPGGWRTRNPFASMYFAAQAMAAEMSTGAPAMMLAEGAPASVSMLVREVRGVFTRRIVGPATFTFSEIDAMRAALDRAVASGESETFVARSAGRTREGEPASEFEITWSFKRR